MTRRRLSLRAPLLMQVLALAHPQGRVTLAVPGPVPDAQWQCGRWYERLGGLLIVKALRVPGDAEPGGAVLLRVRGETPVAALVERVEYTRALPDGVVVTCPSPGGAYWVLHLTQVTTAAQASTVQRELGRATRRMQRLDDRLEALQRHRRETREVLQRHQLLHDALAAGKLSP